MKILFVHQNFPGQYLNLAPRLAERGHEVVALANREVALPGVRVLRYELSRQRAPGTLPLLAKFEDAVDYGTAAAAAADRLKREGFTPDLICAHPGWGETLYLKDVWPGAPQLHYCEYHIAPFSPHQVFDPAPPLTLEQIFAARIRSGIGLFALDAMAAGVSPTHWQRRQFPRLYQDRIHVIHEGINAGLCRPREDAVLVLPDGRRLTRADRVVTYVARNLEPARGFPQFMRALERLLRRDARVEAVIIGGDELSYSAPHPSGRPWREAMLEAVDIDRARVHFLGRVPHPTFVAALQISSAHVYLTSPFVLSWSVLEAMACACLVIASDTEPVKEVMEHGRNSLLCDFFDSDGLADCIADALARPESLAHLRQAARETIRARYALARCLPAHFELIESFAPARAAVA